MEGRKSFVHGENLAKGEELPYFKCCCLANKLPARECLPFLELYLVTALNPVLPPRTPCKEESTSG